LCRQAGLTVSIADIFLFFITFANVISQILPFANEIDESVIIYLLHKLAHKRSLWQCLRDFYGFVRSSFQPT